MSILEQPNLTRDPSLDASVDLEPTETVAVMAEYETVQDVVDAADKVRRAGYTRFDVHSPFPIHGIDGVVGIRMTKLPWIVLCCGLTGLATAAFITHYANGFEIPFLGQFGGYKYLISGKPYLSTAAFIPVMFELTILFSAFGAVFGMLLLNGLPMHYNPLLRSNRFKRVTDDRFFIVIESGDAKYDEVQTTQLLRSTKPVALERVED